MPTNTDLVTDLPADFAVFGQAVDTSMADLLGGTTGQILAKASGTNMDFTWIANDQGDITAVTTTAPLQGGGTSGALALTVDAASTSASGVVQLSNSTSTTSSVLAATPTAVKSAYDLADAAIAKTTVTTAGDIIYRNATVPARLGIGTAGQVLTVNSGATAPQWSTPAGGGGKVLQVVQGTASGYIAITSSNTYTDANLSVSITPTVNTSKILIFVNQQLTLYTSTAAQPNGGYMRILRGSTDIWTGSSTQPTIGQQEVANGGPYAIASMTYLDSPATTSSTTYKTQWKQITNAYDHTLYMNYGTFQSTITVMEIGA